MKVDSFFGMIENWIARRRLTKLKYRLLRFWRRFWGDSIVEIEKPNNFPFGLPVNDTLNSKARIRTIIFHWKKREFIKFRWISSPTQQSIRLSFIWKYINLIRSMHRRCFFFNISQPSSVYSKKKKRKKNWKQRNFSQSSSSRKLETIKNLLVLNALIVQVSNRNRWYPELQQRIYTHVQLSNRRLRMHKDSPNFPCVWREKISSQSTWLLGRAKKISEEMHRMIPRG